MSECRHCGKEQNTPRIRIGIKSGNNTGYFYFPDESCNNDGDGMKQLISKIEELKNSEKKYSMFLQEEQGDRFVNCVEDEQ